VISIIISCGAYALWIGFSDPALVWQGLQKIGIPGILLILSLSLVNYGLRFFRYHKMMQRLGDNLPPIASCLYYLCGFALTTTPGKAGESVRYLYLKAHNVPFRHAIAVLLGERLLDLIAVWIIALLGLWTFEELRWVILVAALLCTMVLLVIRQPLTHRILSRAMHATSLPWLKRIYEFVLATFGRADHLLEFRPLAGGLGIGLLAWSAEALGFVLLVHFLGYDLNPFVLAGIYAAAMLVGALSFLPGGLGGAEATMHLLLTGLAVSSADSVVATLLCRIATLWFAVLIGLLVMMYLESKLGRRHIPSTADSSIGDLQVDQQAKQNFDNRS